MPHEPQKLLQDILDAARAIESFAQDRSLDDYRSDLMLRSAVERQFEIIGEALRRGFNRSIRPSRGASTNTSALSPSGTLSPTDTTSWMRC